MRKEQGKYNIELTTYAWQSNSNTGKSSQTKNGDIDMLSDFKTRKVINMLDETKKCPFSLTRKKSQDAYICFVYKFVCFYSHSCQNWHQHCGTATGSESPLELRNKDSNC